MGVKTKPKEIDVTPTFDKIQKSIHLRWEQIFPLKYETIALYKLKSDADFAGSSLQRNSPFQV